MVGRRVQMDTRNPMLASPSQRVVLGVGMLMSYEGMGTGMLECVRGCHCAVMHIDCSWDKPMSIKARAGRLRARACTGWDAPCGRHAGLICTAHDTHQRVRAAICLCLHAWDPGRAATQLHFA